MARKRLDQDGDGAHASEPLDDPSPAPPIEPAADPEPRGRRVPTFTARHGTIEGMVWANMDERGWVRHAVSFRRLDRTTDPGSGDEAWAVSYNHAFRDLPLV